MQADIRKLRIVGTHPRDDGTSGCTDASSRSEKIKHIFSKEQEKFKELAEESTVMWLDKLAFVAFFRYKMGWSKTASKRHWEKIKSDPDVTTNNKFGAERKVAVRGIECIKAKIGKRANYKRKHEESCLDDELTAKKFRREVEDDITGSYFEDAGCEALRVGASVDGHLAVCDDPDEEFDSSGDDARRLPTCLVQLGFMVHGGGKAPPGSPGESHSQ